MTLFLDYLALPALLFVLFIFFASLALYFYFHGIRKKTEERWSARLHNLSDANQIEQGPVNNSVFQWFLHHTLKRRSKPRKLKKHFLRPDLDGARTPKSSFTAYSHVLTSIGVDTENHRLLHLTGKIIGATVGGLLFFVLSHFNQLPEMALPGFIITLCLFLGAGSFLPDFIVRKMANDRRNHIDKRAPDIIDLLLLSVETGMTFDHALVEVRKILAFYDKTLSREMEQLSADLVILPARSEAFENLVQRTGSETLRYLSVAFSQGEKYGTPIASSLRNVAQDARKRDLIEIDRQAGRLPVTLSIPLMLLILPPVIAISAGPGFVVLMRSFGGEG